MARPVQETKCPVCGAEECLSRSRFDRAMQNARKQDLAKSRSDTRLRQPQRESVGAAARIFDEGVTECRTSGSCPRHVSPEEWPRRTVPLLEGHYENAKQRYLKRNELALGSEARGQSWLRDPTHSEIRRSTRLSHVLSKADPHFRASKGLPPIAIVSNWPSSAIRGELDRSGRTAQPDPSEGRCGVTRLPPARPFGVRRDR